MKLIVLGLDGLSWPVFNNFAKELPNLNRLKETGTYADLKTVEPPSTVPAWVSFQTGRNVGNHGFTSFEEFDEDFNFRLRTGATLDCITFNEILDRAGYKQLIVNMPYSNPARISGDIVHSWLTYRPDPHQMVEPPELYEQLKNIKDYLVFNNFAPEYTSKFYKQLVTYTQKQFDLIKEAISRKDYDSVFCLNSATDGLQHAAYPDIIDNKKGSRSRESMFKVLKIIDDFVGWILNRGFDGNIILVSDHGFKNYGKAFYVNQFLEQEGYLAFSGSGSTVGQIHRRSGGGLPVGRIVLALKSNPRLLALAKFIYKKFIKRLITLEYNDVIDVNKTVAFMPSPAERMIHLRPKERDAEELAAEIIDRINQLGIPVVAKFAHEAYKQESCLDKMPPIVLQSEQVMFLHGVEPKFYNPKARIHWHSSEGIFLGYGPEFKKCQRLDNMHITDAVPTILAAMGIPLSDTFDGIVKKEALSNSYKEVKKKYEWSLELDGTMSAEDQSVVERRLKNLGYL